MNEVIKKIITVLNVRLLIFVFLILALGVYILTVSSPIEPKVKESVRKPETFVLGDFKKSNNKIVVSGIIKPIDIATLAAKTSGTIVNFPVEAGDVLKKGDIVAETEHSLLDAEVSIAEAEYSHMQAQYKQQVELRKSAQKQAQIGVKKADVENISSKNTTEDNLNYAYKNAYNSAEQSLTDAIKAIVVLSDERSYWQRNNSPEEITKIIDAQINAAKILLGADGTSALWNSSYLIKLEGGVRGALNGMDKNQISKNSLDGILKEITSGLNFTKQGLGLVRAIVVLRGSDSQLNIIENKITEINTAIARITKAQEKISQAKLLVKSSVQKQKIITTEASQVLDDSNRNYETAEISAKRAVESAFKRVVYARARQEDSFIRAPFNGVVINKFSTNGESVSPGMKIASIASLSGWKAVFSAADVLNESITKGDMVDVSINGIAGSFSASITRVIPSVDSRSRKIKFEVELPNLPDKTRSGMVVTAQVFTKSVSDINNANKLEKITRFVVPNKFIGYDYDGAFVVTVDEVRIPVTILSRQKGYSVIDGKNLLKKIILKNPLI